MSMFEPNRPLLPLVLDRVPPGLRQVFAQEGVPVVERRGNRAEGRFLIYDSRGGAPRDIGSGQVAIDVDDLRAGWRGDPFEDLLDERSARSLWRIGGFSVSEEIARVDKRAVRRHVMQRLRGLVEAAGGVWFTIGAYPFPYRSAFNLRIDHDEYDPADFDRVLAAIAGHEHATSHFVCGQTHAPHREAVARLRGLDVGSQGYLRHIYQDSDDNLRNIRRGIECLQCAGIEAAGFVAPRGRSNLGLRSALESLGVTHSSEFGLVYDELPFLPAGGEVLQIPVHPVSLGMFLEAAAKSSRDSRLIGEDSNAPDSSGRLWFEQVSGSDSSIRRLTLFEGHRGVLNRQQEETVGRGRIDAAVDAAISHFCELAQSRYQAAEPIFLYCHANGRAGRHPRLLTDTFNAIADLSACWGTNMAAVNAWMRARCGVRVRVLPAESGYSVLVDHQAPGYRLTGELWRGEHVASVPLDDNVVRLTPEALAFEARKLATRTGAVRIDATHRQTPTSSRLGEQGEAGKARGVPDPKWRGWMKRALRRKSEG